MDHIILTSSGWKLFPQLTMDDEIATLKGGQLVYEKPLKLLYYPDHHGFMYHIQSQQISLKVTSNYRLWITDMDRDDYQLVKATELDNQMVMYQTTAHWGKSDYQFILPAVGQQPDKMVDMDAWLTFFGHWIIDGRTNNGHRV